MKALRSHITTMDHWVADGYSMASFPSRLTIKQVLQAAKLYEKLIHPIPSILKDGDRILDNRSRSKGLDGMRIGTIIGPVMGHGYVDVNWGEYRSTILEGYIYTDFKFRKSGYSLLK